MHSTRAKLTCAVGLGLLTRMARTARASGWDQKTTFTFSGPVEIPGQVLPPGTYVFKRADSQAERNIAQVFSKNERHLYGTFLAIPDQRLRPPGRPIITFDERPPASPEAVRAWFYPGENYGHEFVYPKPKAVALAKSNNTPVPSMPAELSANTTEPAPTLTEPHVEALRQAPLKAEKPTEEEVEIAEVFIAQDVAPSAPAAAAPAQLPATGSDLPVIGLAGLLFLGTAGLLRFAAAGRS